MTTLILTLATLAQASTGLTLDNEQKILPPPAPGVINDHNGYAVDIDGDYPSLFKPAWLALEPGGALLATHHSAKTSLEDWLSVCRRCAAKAGRPVEQVDVIPVDADFPSFDGAHPLKMAVFR